MESKLQVPENIPLRWEAWRGIGRAELCASLAITAVVLILAIVYCLVSTAESDLMVAVMAVGMTFAFSTGLFSKLENNQSIYDYIVRQINYKREQQVFLYQREKEEVWFVQKEE